MCRVFQTIPHVVVVVVIFIYLTDYSNATRFLNAKEKMTFLNNLDLVLVVLLCKVA